VSPYRGLGGAGRANSISGSSVTYAVGGDGVASTPTNGAAGTTNRGNGGAGGGTSVAGGAGGSGVVIIRYVTVNNPIKVSIGSSNTPTNTLGVYGTIGASGTITGSTTPDIAETIKAAADVEAADVVVADPDQPESVIKSSKPYDPTVLGVISDGTSAFLINSYSYSEGGPLTGKPLVLAGRVPVKVTNDGVAIKPGDELTTSSTPGHAMKATHSGPTIGKALASFDGASGTVLALINLSYKHVTTATALQGPAIDSLLVNGELQTNSLTVETNATINGTLTLAGHIITAGETPTATAEPGAGVGATATIDGNDQAGTITVTTGTDPSQGILTKVTFHKPYTKVPKVILTPANAKAASLQYYADSAIDHFDLSSLTAPATETYKYYYWIVE